MRRIRAVVVAMALQPGRYPRDGTARGLTRGPALELTVESIMGGVTAFR